MRSDTGPLTLSRFLAGNIINGVENRMRQQPPDFYATGGGLMVYAYHGNATAVTFVGLVAVALAGAIFVMLELDGPLDGVVKVSSDSMRHALQHLDNRASPSG